MDKPPLGYPGNPVIGILPPEGQKWRIVDKWPLSDSMDTSPQTDLALPHREEYMAGAD